MKRLCLVICAGLLLAACGGSSSGPPKLNLKADGKDSVLDIKSGVMRTTEQAQSKPEWSAAKYEFTLANFDLNTTSDLMKTLSKPEETRVFFRIDGDKATNKDTTLKPGTYSAEAKEFPMFDNSSLAIFTFADGKQSIALSQNSPGNATKGDVKIIVPVLWLVGLIPTLSGLGHIIAGLSIKPGPAKQIGFPESPLRIESTVSDAVHQDPAQTVTPREIPPSVTDRTTNILDRDPGRQKHEVQSGR